MATERRVSKPQYRTLVKALTDLCNVVHDELDGAGELPERRRRLRRNLNQAEEVLIRALQAKKETDPRPCNEMGGGSSGLDTADDFAKHCGKPDRHDGPHSYEEE